MRRERANQMMFKEYVEQWAVEYTLPNGERIAGGTRRNLYLDIAHFMPAFEGLRLTEIKPRHIKNWYDGLHPEGQWSFRRAYAAQGRVPLGHDHEHGWVPAIA